MPQDFPPYTLEYVREGNADPVKLATFGYISDAIEAVRVLADHKEVVEVRIKDSTGAIVNQGWKGV